MTVENNGHCCAYCGARASSSSTGAVQCQGVIAIYCFTVFQSVSCWPGACSAVRSIALGYRCIVLSSGLPVQCSTLVRSSNRTCTRFAGSVSCFTSIAIDRVDTCMYGYVWCDHASDRSEEFRLQANDVTWPAVACVCKSMKLGMHSV